MVNELADPRSKSIRPNSLSPYKRYTYMCMDTPLHLSQSTPKLESMIDHRPPADGQPLENLRH